MIADGTLWPRFKYYIGRIANMRSSSFSGIGRINTAGAAWLALPSELHISNGVSVPTRAESGLKVAGISSVWQGISSVSYLSSMGS
jgi:hypothetical protein